jgi:hypothetical protein
VAFAFSIELIAESPGEPPPHLEEVECKRRAAVTRALATMATEEGHGPIEGMIGRPPIQTDLGTPHGGDASAAADTMLDMRTHFSFKVAGEQCEYFMHGKRQRTETSESATTGSDYCR